MFRRSVRSTLVALGAALFLSACAAPSTPPGTDHEPIGSVSKPIGSVSKPITASESPTADRCAATSAVLRHQAPELESLLPDTVQGRSLARWSVRGRCWAELALDGRSVPVDDFLQSVETSGGPPIDLDNVAYAVAGRSDTATDPPYFVWVANRPLDEDEINLTLILLFGGAGYHDVAAGIDPQNYEQRTISGKEVHVGSESMVDQNVHQRGRPYFYETEDRMFLLITDDDAWAADAIGQLP